MFLPKNPISFVLHSLQGHERRAHCQNKYAHLQKTSLNIIDVLVSLDYFAICGPFAVRAIIPCLQPSNLLRGHYLAVTGYTAT